MKKADYKIIRNYKNNLDNPIRAKQLSMAATARVIWLCACVRDWQGRGLMYVCPLF